MYFFLRRFFKYLAPLLVPLERRLVNKYSKEDLACAPVFIIGAPRTGSTILYQLLTDYLRVSYISNFVNLGPRTLFLCSLLGERIYRGRPHATTRSEFGRTSRKQLNAPHEGAAFWYRWLPKNEDYIGKDRAAAIPTDGLKDTVTAITNRFNRPFLFKYLNAGLKIALIRKVFPDARFIFIKRDPLFTIQSVLMAREKVYGDFSRWWSFRPPGSEMLEGLDPVAQVTAQVLGIERQIAADLKAFVDDRNHVTVHYEELADASRVLCCLQKFIGDVTARKEIPEGLSLQVNNRERLNGELIEKIKEQIIRFENH